MLRKLHGAVTVQPSGIYESTYRYRMTVGRAEKDLDKTTHTYTTQIDELVKHKEGELLEV